MSVSSRMCLKPTDYEWDRKYLNAIREAIKKYENYERKKLWITTR